MKQYPNEETRLFMEGMKRRRKEWKAWTKLQVPIIVRLLDKAVRSALRGRLQEANRAAWNAGQAIREIDNVWVHISAKGNKFITTIPKEWKKWLAKKRGNEKTAKSCGEQ